MSYLPGIRLSSILLAAFLFPTFLSAQVSVIPEATGWGIETPAGRGGAIVRVTNLNGSGPGSLASALGQSGPRVIIFEVSGTIVLTNWLFIDNPYVTVAGQTAPSPGITIRGAGIRIRTHDVLLQHLRVRVGDGGGVSAVERDGLEILANEQNCYNIVIDHCSFSWGIDENVSIYSPNSQYTNHDITVRYCIISEGLLNSIHPKGQHSMGLLVGGNSGGRHDNISFVGNLMAHNNQRNPMSQSRSLVNVNNLTYNWGEYGVTILSEGAVNKSSVVGNVYLAGLDSDPFPPITLSRLLLLGSQVYLSDNLAPGYSQTYSNWARGFNPIVNDPPVWPEGLTVLTSGQTEDDVLANAGSRPLDRDEVDDRIVSDVINGTGRLIDSQNDVGGWPVLAQNTRILVTPSNPNGDDDGDGYTNLEEWLHGYSAEVGGDGGNGGSGGGGGGTAVTLFTESFDSGNIPGSAWTHGDLNSSSGEDYWDDQTSASGARVFSGSSSLYCADIGDVSGQIYDHNMNAHFTLNNGIDISGLESVTVRFWSWYRTSNSSDYFSFEYLSGTQWVELGRWSGRGSGTWAENLFVIPPDAGQTLFFRWIFVSNGSRRTEGAYIDDLLVTALETEAARMAGEGEDKAAPMETAGLNLNGEIPGSFKLEQNYPNPFNPSTMISFSLPEDAHTTLVVVDLLGREVARLVDGAMKAGSHSVRFTGSDLANGVYLYTLQAGSFRETKRMILVK